MHLCRIKTEYLFALSVNVSSSSSIAREIIELYALFGQIAQNGILRLLDQPRTIATTE